MGECYPRDTGECDPCHEGERDPRGAGECDFGYDSGKYKFFLRTFFFGYLIKNMCCVLLFVFLKLCIMLHMF